MMIGSAGSVNSVMSLPSPLFSSGSSSLSMSSLPTVLLTFFEVILMDFTFGSGISAMISSGSITSDGSITIGSVDWVVALSKVSKKKGDAHLIIPL